jgi:hypothetical protein
MRATVRAVRCRILTQHIGFNSEEAHVEFVVNKLAVGQISLSISGFPSQLSFHRYDGPI